MTTVMLSTPFGYPKGSRSMVIPSISRFRSDIPTTQSMPDLRAQVIEPGNIVINHLASNEERTAIESSFNGEQTVIAIILGNRPTRY